MPKTVRSQLLQELLPAIRGGIRASRLPPPYSEDVEQDVLISLAGRVEHLSEMPERGRIAYAFVAASRSAIAARKALCQEDRRFATDEILSWDAGAAARSITPEHIVATEQRAARAEKVLADLDTRDRDVVDAMAEPGLSERDAAQKLGVSRGSLVFRLRRARELLGKALRSTVGR